jgi:hypothetical protein
MALPELSKIVEAEKERLLKAKESAQIKLKEITAELEQIDNRLRAAELYERAANGEVFAAAPSTRGRPARTSSGTRAPRGSKKEELIKLLSDKPGLKRAEIIDALGMKGEKSGEQSISNTLASLKKSGELLADGGKYTVAPSGE